MSDAGSAADVTTHTGLRAQLGGDLEFERVGVDRIDEAARTSTPWTFFLVLCGASVAPASLVFGWIPITFGLGFWAAFSSIVVGTLVGTAVLAPLIAIGSHTATNNSTSSGAHFGVRGRVIGSGIGLAIMVTGVAIAIWTSGGILVGVSNRLFSTPTSDGALGLTYGALAILAVLIAIYGYHLLVRVTTAVALAGGLALVLLPVAFAGDLDFSYQGGAYLLGDFWSTWLLSAITVGVAAVMFACTLVGDWTRYISARRFPTARLLPIASLAVVLAYVVTLGIGALVTTAFADPFAPFPLSLAADAPAWYAVVLLPLALFGGLGMAAALVYSGGLDLDAIFPRLTRAGATTVVSTVSVAVLFIGSFAWDASESIATASLVLLALSAPWAAVVGIGFIRTRGRYNLDDLQVFNRRERGGVYWFTGGWNWRAVVAWAVGCTFGLLTVQTTLFNGPWWDVAGGVDISFLGSFTIAAALYLAFELLFPPSASGMRTPSSGESAAASGETPPELIHPHT